MRQQPAASDLAAAINDSYERVLVPRGADEGKAAFDAIDLGTVLGAGRGLHSRVREALANQVFGGCLAATATRRC